MPPPTDRLSAEQIQDRFDNSPAISPLGLKVLALDYDNSELRVEMPLNPSLERRAGSKQFHGGPIASFIDTVGDYAIGMMLGGPPCFWRSIPSARSASSVKMLRARVRFLGFGMNEKSCGQYAA